MKPMLSIITPSYNLGELIGRTIESVLVNESNQIEYIVVDGGSTDATLKVLKKYKRNYPTKNFSFISEPDNGQAHAINKGIRLSSGDWIAWINADDYYEWKVLDALLPLLDKAKNFSVVYGNNLSEAEKSDVKNTPPSKITLKSMRHGNVIFQPASFLNRKFLNHTPLLDESLTYWMDYDIYLKLIKLAPFKYIDLLISHFTVRSDQISDISNIAEMNKESNKVWLNNTGSPTLGLTEKMVFSSIYKLIKLIHHK
jgi:glycosyltransferase involved in cell wall biosynthesis